MGAGKSTIGRLLAKELRLPFKDSDKEIELRTGANIPWIFDKEGELGFRDREQAMIAELCGCDGVVLATGGGAVMRDENRRPPQLLQLGESALSVSYQMLTEQQKLDWRRLAVLPLEFDPIEAAVVWGLLLPGATQEQKEDAWFEADLRLIDLRDYNLVEFNESQRKYSLLNAFRPYARLKMTSQEANAARQALEAYRAV
jgi:hypothetical protein